MSGKSLLKRPRVESTTVLTAVETCSKEVINLKLAFNQRLNNFENQTSAVSSGFFTMVQRMETLENLMKNFLKSDNKRHSCCDEVLRKLTKMEELITSLISVDTTENQIVKS